MIEIMREEDELKKNQKREEEGNDDQLRVFTLPLREQISTS
jgi:hypothetical protein